MTPVSVFKLSSGVTCAFRPASSPVCYCALSTLAGTRYEPEGLYGLAHFCEHMLFKGTEKRTSYHINNRLERLGGEINAFTTKEELVLHTMVLKEDVGKALDLLADLALHSVIPEKEMSKERDVILDEIRLYKDAPSDLIYDRFEELLFSGTPMATPILGTPKALRNIRSADMLRYLQARFQPAHMALSMVGHFSPARAQALAEKYFGACAFGLREDAPTEAVPSALCAEGSSGTTPTTPSARTTPSAPLTVAPATQPFHEEEHRNTHQIHCLVGTTAYAMHHKGRIPLALLMNILGGPASNAKLNMLMREKYGLVYAVEASYAPYIDTGFAGVYFGTDKPKLDACRDILDKVLRESATTLMTGLQLDRAKKQLIGQLAIADDNPESQCLSMGKNLLSFGKVPSHEQTVDAVRAVTPQQVLEVAATIWNPNRQSSLLYY